MEVSSQDPSLMAMDLSKSYSVNPLTRSHAEAMDLAKKPEWYHRRPPSCSTDIGSSYRSRASSSYNSLRPDAGAPVHCREMEQGPEALGNYMNSALYHDGVHGNLWHPGFYGTDQSGGPGPESSGGEESDSGSDVIVLVSSAKEPLLCGSFIQESVRHIVEPLSPAVSSLDEGRGCYHLPQPLSSPSPDSSYSEEDSSDSSVDIPVHHTRPVVLLSDLGAVYGNPADSPVDISSDDSDVIEVSVTNEKKKGRTFTCKKSVPCKKSLGRETPPQSEGEKAPTREVRRSSRIRKSVSEMPPSFTCGGGGGSRHSLRRQVKNDVVGIYNESCDSDDMMEYAAARLSSSDADESQQNLSQRVSSNSEDEDDSDRDARTRTDRKSLPSKSPQREEEEEEEEEEQQQQQLVCRKASYAKSINHKRKKPLNIPKSKRLRRSKQKQNRRIPPKQQQQRQSRDAVAGGDGEDEAEATNKKTVIRRKKKKKRHSRTGPSAPFPPREPEIQLKYAKLKEATAKKKEKKKKSDSFVPFVHIERRVCTVVNYREDEATVRSSRGKQQLQQTTSSAVARSVTGFVPNTSCFQLGRLSSESRCHSALLCCLCGQVANARGLGDLHGPYCPTGPPADSQNQNHQNQNQQQTCRTMHKQEVNSHGLSSSLSPVNSSDEYDCSAVVDSLPGNDGGRSRPKVPPLPLPLPLHLDECWMHEDCGIWSAGVFLVRGKLYGLEEAARLAQETICSTCQLTGAIMGCFQKGCPRNYHYRCAIQSGCVLNEDNFSMRCPEHKNKLFTSVTRQHKR